ncbi:hypothetical protein AXG93_2675s1070 [Marchantia polymorpha subsp. ruderalis]|uniref:ABC transporter domain-containing protein n=1 Tax=Marchantia polymorpha subsp. ruderalis TaxID=1480154 RepID=A0A176VP46_MARPO|nr:hypothetical protein AXG93_2675s1070 [Marchantia polymorpha subsp. ruderalis]
MFPMAPAGNFEGDVKRVVSELGGHHGRVAAAAVAAADVEGGRFHEANAIANSSANANAARVSDEETARARAGASPGGVGEKAFTARLNIIDLDEDLRRNWKVAVEGGPRKSFAVDVEAAGAGADPRKNWALAVEDGPRRSFAVEPVTESMGAGGMDLLARKSISLEGIWQGEAEPRRSFSYEDAAALTPRRSSWSLDVAPPRKSADGKRHSEGDRRKSKSPSFLAFPCEPRDMSMELAKLTIMPPLNESVESTPKLSATLPVSLKVSLIDPPPDLDPYMVMSSSLSLLPPSNVPFNVSLIDAAPDLDPCMVLSSLISLPPFDVPFNLHDVVSSGESDLHSPRLPEVREHRVPRIERIRELLEGREELGAKVPQGKAGESDSAWDQRKGASRGDAGDAGAVGEWEDVAAADPRWSLLQDDILYAHLTVRETLVCAALLRLPRELSRKEKLRRAQDVITELGLERCHNTMVGGSYVRGVSGGERKRVSIGCEMLTDPSLLLLDEPTSGLDSTAALSMVRTMRNLAQSGKTIISTIHQPSSVIFHMFDKVLLLSEGQPMFYGKGSAALDYFESIGFHPTFATNPADFLLDLANGELLLPVRLSVVRACRSQVDSQWKFSSRIWLLTVSYTLVELSLAGCAIPGRRNYWLHLHGGVFHGVSDLAHSVWVSSPSAGVTHNLDDLHREVSSAVPRRRRAKDQAEERNCVKKILKEAYIAHIVQESKTESMSRELKPKTFQEMESYHDTVSKREWSTSWPQQFAILSRRALKERRHDSFSAPRILETLLVAVISGLIWWDSSDKIEDQVGLLFFSSTIWGFFPLFNSIFTFPQERDMLRKERSSGMYRLSAYFLAQSTVDVPMELVLPFIYMVIVYWMGGLKANAVAFLATCAAVMSNVLVAQGLGLAIGAVCMNIKHASTSASVMMLTFLLAGGFYAKDIAPALRWLKYVSFSYHGFKLELNSQFGADDEYPCSTGQCRVADIDAVSTVGLGGNLVSALAMLGLFVGFRLIAYIALRRTKI